MLEEQESDLSDIETESQDVLERSNMDEIFDNYVPVSDYDDRGISFEQVDLTENPQEVPVRDNTHQAIPLSQTSIMSYIFPNGSVEQVLNL
ncbi:unnamed protein product [Orchesella dallaii]|uniref:Uncharacterized protein n=1 Tax=Orchesella dallaii TaxID=48710 RepID=A0ABP1RSG4_9HEXA